MDHVYGLLLRDSFFHALIIPFSVEFIFPTMLIFQRYNELVILLAVLPAYSIGAALNYFIGRSIIQTIDRTEAFSDKSKQRFGQCAVFFNRYLVWFLVFVGFNLAELLHSTIERSQIEYDPWLAVFAGIGYAIGLLMSALGSIFMVIAGLLRTPLWLFLCLICSSRAIYYVITILTA